MSVGDAIAEYRAFAYPKARALDEIFIESFDRDALLQFARKNKIAVDNCIKDRANVILDSMATGGDMKKPPFDEFRSVTALRSAYTCPKLSGF